MPSVAAFYRFTPIPEPRALQGPIARLACSEGLGGTVLLAREGINGTVAGPAAGVERLLAHLRALPGLAGLAAARSRAAEPPFRRLKVRVKPEIVSFGAPADPARRTGARVAAADWNQVLDDPDTVLIDTRNAYEVAIGRFEGAVDPGTAGFRDFPGWWAANADRFRGRRVAMYCTGGIRCEKASAWLLGQGVRQVAQLDGGILGYLATVPAAESRWRGECFVFDGRVALGHGLADGTHALCHACGRPVGPEGRASPDWRAGVSCPACIDAFTAEDRARFAERERQARLARARGRSHFACAARGR